MSPVFDTRQLGDLLIELSGADVADGAETYLDFVKKRWEKIYDKASKKPATFLRFWQESVERGGYFADYSRSGSSSANLKIAALNGKFEKPEFSDKGAAKKGPVLYPYPSVKSFDGRAANRPWLQELPDPITKAVWGSWVEMHPVTAKKYGVKQGDAVKLSTHYGEVNAPAYVTEYVSKDVVAVPIGDGHSSYGRFATEEGGNVLQMLPDQLALKGAAVQLLSTRVGVEKGPVPSKLVVTQGSDSQMDRHLARTKTLEPGHHDDHHDGHHGHHDEVEHFYDQRKHPLYHWGLAVDLSACTGCSACVVACYAENNIPTVGKDVCAQGREMSWLMIDRYYDGPAEELTVTHQPRMCQHCNNAPCEPVCPVYATYHTEEGLNAMVYNRCVGTRYCGNNCSYKVRRYNWFEFDWPEPLNWQLNPDVTKRTAGVMEKCSFCVQRINEGKDRAKDEGRVVNDGEIKPACVQSCPTEALVFGNLNDKDSKVSKLSKSDKAYKVLDHHLNTQPAVSYLENVKHKV
jgi:molybdopterin-containing oxidoreductase family iron-sulfur binding subunit